MNAEKRKYEIIEGFMQLYSLIRRFFLPKKINRDIYL